MEELLGQTCEMEAVRPLPPNTVEAMAYVPFQQFQTTYPSDKALDAGTLFPELDKPFYGRRGVGK